MAVLIAALLAAALAQTFGAAWVLRRWPFFLLLPVMLDSAVLALLKAKAKGRSGWWLLAGLLLPIVGNLILSVATDRDRETARDEQVRRLREEIEDLRRKRLFDHVLVGDIAGTPICPGCANSNRFLFCSEFGVRVTAVVTHCDKFRPVPK